MDVLEDTDALRYPDFLLRKCGYSMLDNISEHLKVFKVFLYVKQFNSEDISVKTVDRTLIIRGAHREHLDKHGLITREFKREYSIPEGFEPKSVSAVLSSNGILKIYTFKSILWDEFLTEEEKTFKAYINLSYYPLKELSFKVGDNVMKLHARLVNIPGLLKGSKDKTELFKEDINHLYYLPRDIVPSTVHAQLVPNEMIEVKGKYKSVDQLDSEDQEGMIRRQASIQNLEDEIISILEFKSDISSSFKSWLKAAD